MADLEKNKGGGWLDWEGINRPLNTEGRSLNPKYQYEYRGGGGGVGGVASYPIHLPGSAIGKVNLMINQMYVFSSNT